VSAHFRNLFEDFAGRPGATTTSGVDDRKHNPSLPTAPSMARCGLGPIGQSLTTSHAAPIDLLPRDIFPQNKNARIRCIVGAISALVESGLYAFIAQPSPQLVNR